MKYLFVFSLLSGEAHAIVGGTVVSSNDPVAKVTVQIFNYNHSDDCTGEKLGPHFVLTAAHCAGMAFDIRSSSGKTYLVSESYKDDQWHPNTNSAHDFAVLRVSPALPGPYAKIADGNRTPKKGNAVYIAGYGENRPGFESDNQLRKIQLKMGDPDFSSSGALIEGHGIGPCAGDSGGPAYIVESGQVIIWGVDSADKPGSKKMCRDGEIYDKAAVANEWIKQTIREPTGQTASAVMAEAIN